MRAIFIHLIMIHFRELLWSRLHVSKVLAFFCGNAMQVQLVNNNTAVVPRYDLVH